MMLLTSFESYWNRKTSFGTRIGRDNYALFGICGISVTSSCQSYYDDLSGAARRR
jgi:hypothetical protein